MKKISSHSQPHYLGHRKRLKDKFLSAPDALGDYELLELLLFQSIPRRDVKPLAKELLQKLGGLNQVINAELPRILEIAGSGNNNIFTNFQIIKQLISRVLKEQIINKNAISSWSDLLNYLKFNMGNLKLEQFRVLFLNKKNVVIADEVMSNGTIDQTSVYPREVIKRSLYHEAGAIILIHNHPSGSSKPSQADIELTNKIVESCKAINVTVHDHVVISSSEFYSFKSNMLL